MSSWMNNLRAFGRQAPRNNNNNINSTSNNNPPSRGNASSPATYSPSSLHPPPLPGAPASPSLAATTGGNDPAHRDEPRARNEPMFFREKYATLIVKGNFMTLAAKPQQVEEAEWLAHQIVEQTRLLGGMLKTVQEPDRTTGRAICNEQSCPTMSAGPRTTYSWIDTNRNPINLPATTYIRHIQTWVNGKIQDQALFPTDNFAAAPQIFTPEQQAADPNYWLGKTSGFPQRFETEIKNMYKQMFRCYAHLYWTHWLVFWDLNFHRELNTCFVHFMNVGRIYNLLAEKDVEPMAPLVELWVKQGVLPQVSVIDDSRQAAGNATASG